MKRPATAAEKFPDPETDLAQLTKVPRLPAAVRTIRKHPVLSAGPLGLALDALHVVAKGYLVLRSSILGITPPPRSDLMEPAKNVIWQDYNKNGNKRYQEGK